MTSPAEPDTPVQVWTRFRDMNSGGKRKMHWTLIYIQAPEREAISVFYARFGHNPERVTCTCCGEDYSISEERGTLEQITAFERGCRWDRLTKRYIEAQDERRKRDVYRTLFDYMQDDGVLIIGAGDIEPHEREQDVPPEGYVWV